MLFVVSGLHGERKRAVQVIEPLLWVAALDFHPTDARQGFEVFRVAAEDLRVKVARLIERPRVFVYPGETELNIQITRRSLSQIPV